MKVLILGSYGVFGGRLAELLSGLGDVQLLIAGRNFEKATAFCNSHESAAMLMPVQADRAQIRGTLIEHKPDLLVDASGPFQEYGNEPYEVVRACIENRIDYLDFADGSDFVFGISQFDQAAKEAGIFVLSGVSSYPVLTAAVIAEFSKQMDVHTVTGGIAPSPYAGVGMNVMRAVISYAGGDVKLMRNGVMINAQGLTESKHYTVAVPGRLPLHSIRYSLIDVPDLQVIPRVFDGVSDIWMGAGPAPELLLRILNLLAKLRGTLRLPSYAPLAPLFYRVLNLMKFGEHRGGMFIEVSGQGKEGNERRSWHLLAEGDDGPYIPSMATELIIRKLIEGDRPINGARPAVAELTLEDYNRAFAGRSIYTGFRHQNDSAKSIFAHVLGDCMDQLPMSLRAFHLCGGNTEWRGEATVRSASNGFGRLLARIIGFPNLDGVCPVHVCVEKTPTGEIWQRTIGGRTFRSTLSLGSGREEHLLCERFGPITFGVALVWNSEKLYLAPRRWRLGWLPLPKFLLPKGNSFERDDDGVFTFNVEIAAPLINRIVAYRGKLRRIDNAPLSHDE